MKLNTLGLIFIVTLLSVVRVTYAGPEKPQSGLHGTVVIKEEQPGMRGINVLKGSDITSTQTPPVEHEPTFNESLKNLERKKAPQQKVTPGAKPE